MSDHEGTSGAVDDELSLPKATVQKLIAGESVVRDVVAPVFEADAGLFGGRDSAQGYPEL
jgi:hypothetical protein